VEGLPDGTRVFRGPHALDQAFAEVDIDLLVNAIVGAAGLRASYLTLRQGKQVATANKESLVIAGELLTGLARAHDTAILPIDSEHSAIWQCLRAGRAGEVDKLWLTASGGPFRTRPAETFGAITVEEALGHPTWRMGEKITIDSATMMNKGFEIIEAHWLFDVPEASIAVAIHPESIVHSAVSFTDGSLIAQMGSPDMQHPIQYALLYPDRCGPAPSKLDLDSVGHLHFEAPDEARFPALRLARQALAAGGAYPIVLNAANEVAVRAFLGREIAFSAITECVAVHLDATWQEPVAALDDIYEVDRKARAAAAEWLAGHRSSAGLSHPPARF
jgi:1-deoxy-D-xylulose-5-phosphate reductoisomerase